jgi:hypothetical protein
MVIRDIGTVVCYSVYDIVYVHGIDFVGYTES